MIDSTLQIFTRAPIPGRTKSRLIPLLGALGAAEFHQSMLLKIISQARRSDYDNIQIYCDSQPDHPFLQQCSRDLDSQIYLQQGHDLGEKMHHAIHTALAVSVFVTLIGSDCPTLSTALLNQSHRYLAGGKGAVLGASDDGGYYLIGMRQTCSEIFRGINWGGSDVAAQTRQRLSHSGIDYAELTQLADIDTPDDYQRYTQQSLLIA